MPGAFVGLALLALAIARMLDLFIGSVVVVATLVIAAGIHVTRTNSAKFLAGLVSGVLQALGISALRSGVAK